MSSYYNEIDPFKANVLREAIKADAIATGDVDERSITDVEPADLVGCAQAHFFAGGGFWSLALRLAGWPDDRPVWTGSCPCPSFSAAGKGAGFDDPRHLWPAWFALLRQCRPPVVFGEQVAAAIGHGWLDLVCRDLEAEGYAVAAAVLGAHSVGAPHIRQRLYFCAVARREERTGRTPERPERPERPDKTDRARQFDASGVDGTDVERAHTQRGPAERRRSGLGAAARGSERAAQQRERLRPEPEHGGDAGHGHQPDGAGPLAGRPASPTLGHRSSTDAAGSAGHGGDPTQRGLGIAGSAPGQPGHAARADEIERGADASEGGRRARLGNDDARQPDAEGSRPDISDLALGPGLEGHFGDVREWRGPGWLDPLTARSVAEAGATRGFWADCDWWYGRDGKYRPAGPGVFPLAHGSPARVGRLRLYGDAIVVPLAAEFIRACRETIDALKEAEREGVTA